jgi:GTPase SAR1 family protein
VGAFVVFDLSKNEDSGASIRGWKADIDEKVRMPNGECIPTVLLGSKCDLVERREWSNTEIDRMCESNRFRHWFEVSAKTKVNVTEANSYLVTLMLKMKEVKEAGDDGSVYTVASANELAETTLIPKSSAIILDRSSELLMDESCCV